MTFGDHLGFSTAVDAVGVDHVRLGYQYLDRGDRDGYASLLDAAAVLDEPGHEQVRGRGAVAGLRRARGRGEHDVREVFSADGQVAAVGRFVGREVLDFADIFTVSDSGLLVSQRCYYFVHPR
ncbi:nuclear transport factor 2 family protein [Actinophytocola sp.]|jgi:hypothetical protein|uniref:nuclear transport factor 2 family protein n=1 Tax=Actinophytocola sp. TaxID=1872138 RepID=UPI002ED7F23F